MRISRCGHGLAASPSLRSSSSARRHGLAAALRSMNGIDFIVRDRGGWIPPVPLPRRRLRWTDPKAKAVKPEEIEFIRAARGRSPPTTWASATAYHRRPSATFGRAPIKRTMTDFSSNRRQFARQRY